MQNTIPQQTLPQVSSYRPFRFSSTDSQLESEIPQSFQNHHHLNHHHHPPSIQSGIFQRQQQHESTVITPISESTAENNHHHREGGGVRGEEYVGNDYNTSLLPSLNKLDLNLPQSPRNSVAYGNLRSNLNTNSACPTSVYTTVNPTTGYRYSGYHNESIYTVETNSSSRMANHQSHQQQQQRQMSVVIPEYHEHLRNDLYETKRQLLEETASRKSQKSDTSRNPGETSVCCCCFSGKTRLNRKKSEVRGLNGYKDQKRKENIKSRYSCVGTCMTVLTVMCLVVLIMLFICFMMYVAWYQATMQPSYYEYLDK